MARLRTNYVKKISSSTILKTETKRQHLKTTTPFISNWLSKIYNPLNIKVTF